MFLFLRSMPSLCALPGLWPVHTLLLGITWLVGAWITSAPFTIWKPVKGMCVWVVSWRDTQVHISSQLSSNMFLWFVDHGSSKSYAKGQKFSKSEAKPDLTCKKPVDWVLKLVSELPATVFSSNSCDHHSCLSARAVPPSSCAHAHSLPAVNRRVLLQRRRKRVGIKMLGADCLPRISSHCIQNTLH